MDLSQAIDDQPFLALTPREEIDFILSRYDSGALPPAVGMVILRLAREEAGEAVPSPLPAEG